MNVPATEALIMAAEGSGPLMAASYVRFVAVPELTRSADIKLNERVLLRYLFEILSSRIRTVWPDVHFPC